MRVDLTVDDRKFLAALHRSGPQRVSELCCSMKVTATAVRNRLTRLMSAGVLERQIVPNERGRPYHTYSVSAAGLRELGDDYPALAQILWRKVLEVRDDGVRSRLLQGVRRAFVERYSQDDRPQAIPERFEQLCETLAAEGFEVDVDCRRAGERSIPVLREHTCPYHEMAAEDRTVCELEQSVFEDVLGLPIALTQCCHDGHNCCEFEPATASEETAELTVGNEVTKR